MNNYRFTISYDGSRYSGWEHQKHTDDTIQGKIEAVLAKMCETDTVKLVFACTPAALMPVYTQSL